MKLIILLLIFFSSIFNITKHPTTVENSSIFSLEEYQDLKKEDIKKIEKIHFGEGGASDPEIYQSREEIETIYTYLSSIKILGETKMQCDDNTTEYTIYFTDGSLKRLSFDCNVLVLKDKRLLVDY